MQSPKIVGPDLTKLDLDEDDEGSDRFVYQSRFVPFILHDSNGNPVVSVIQQLLSKCQTRCRGKSAEVAM